MTELEKYINGYFKVRGKDLSVIASFFKPEALKKGDHYLLSGEVCNKLSFVQSGFIRLYAVVDDKEVTQWLGSKGAFMGDMASLTFDIPSRWNIRALTDIELYTIQKAQYDNIYEHVPRWAEIEKHFIVNCFTTMESRIYSFLSMSAEERYSAFFHQNKELFNQVPLHFIASMLGMTPETFSRIRKKISS